MLLTRTNTPRWIIFFIDTVISFFSVILAYSLRFNFSIPPQDIQEMPFVLAVILLVRIISFSVGRTYAGIIRYTSSKDAQRIVAVITAGSLIFCISNLVTWLINSRFYLPFSIIIIDYMATIFLMVLFRLSVRSIYQELKNPSKEKRNVIIFGAGEAGIITKRTLDRDAGTKYKVIAFLDDNRKKSGKKLEGITIHHAEKLSELLAKNPDADLIISIQNLPAKRKNEVVEIALSNNIKVLHVPPVNSWINGELSFKQIKTVKIEDLLEREVILLDEQGIGEKLKGKRVLITGAAGSIGSELARQIIKYQPAKLILLDQAESPLYDLELELNAGNPTLARDENGCETVIGDITNQERMKNLFVTFQPEMVYHAAAYKHVPVMESNPSEAIFTNVLGTKILAELSDQHKVKEFVMVSTDKAVNPTGVMGASKRIAEMFIQSKNQVSSTLFITTRFGNVLGSNGSVIPRFKAQIESGGPVTITHPEITRYFMTIPEASQLVLQASVLGENGEIFLFDMGVSVKIEDLAKKMIQLSGLTIGKDIEIKYTGLRPGEKLYEELLNDLENTLPTPHPKIMIARVREYDHEKVSHWITELVTLARNQDNDGLVRKMKEIVPEYVSNNSVFEDLDKKKELKA